MVKMIKYEQPQVEIYEFLAREPMATGNINEPALIDDTVSMGTTPTFNEGIEDW